MDCLQKKIHLNVESGRWEGNIPQDKYCYDSGSRCRLLLQPRCRSVVAPTATMANQGAAMPVTCFRSHRQG